jgi:two-component system sensor histidine kinase RpfC
MSGALRQRLLALRGRLQGRADSEHEQALIRLAVGAVFFFYLLPEALDGGPDAWSLEKSLFLPMLGFMALAAGIFAAIVISPGASPARRVFGAVVDSAAASYFMARTGVNGLPRYVVAIISTATFYLTAIANWFKRSDGETTEREPESR